MSVQSLISPRITTFRMQPLKLSRTLSAPCGSSSISNQFQSLKILKYKKLFRIQLILSYLANLRWTKDFESWPLWRGRYSRIRTAHPGYPLWEWGRSRRSWPWPSATGCRTADKATENFGWRRKFDCHPYPRRKQSKIQSGNLKFNFKKWNVMKNWPFRVVVSWTVIPKQERNSLKLTVDIPQSPTVMKLFLPLASSCWKMFSVLE